MARLGSGLQISPHMRMKHLLIITLVMTLPCIASFLQAQGDGQYHQLETTVNGLTRNYTLYEPPGHDGTEAWPLVFVFHGFATPVDIQIEIAQMYLVADTAKFFVIYPHGLMVEDLIFGGTDVGWHVPFSVGTTDADIPFVSQIIDELDTKPDFSVDLCRVHATGWSNGGEFSLYLACALSDRIASVASVAEPMTDTMVSDICIPARQISVMHIQGTDDPFFPPDGQGPFASAAENAAFWAANNNCDAMPEMTDFARCGPS